MTLRAELPVQRMRTLSGAAGFMRSGSGFLLVLGRATDRAAGRKFVGKFGAPRRVAPEHRILAHAVLQAGEIGRQLRRAFRRQAVDHPIGLLARLDQPVRAQVREVLGNLHLRLAEDLLKVADTQLPALQQVQDAQPRRTTEALVDFDELHGGLTALRLAFAASTTRAGIAGLESAALPCEAVGMLVAQRENQLAAARLR